MLKAPVKKIEDFWETLGPGMTTGAADDDPSGIATYSQTGARYGFQLLWLAPLTFPLMAMIQEMCARIGMATGRGLGSNIRLHFGKGSLFFITILLFIANTFNVGADIGVMAKAVQLLWPAANFALLVILITLFSIVLQVFISYRTYAKYLKWLSLSLLAYVLSLLIVKIDWPQLVFHTVVPSLEFSKEQIILICGILGTTISPYLFFWQTSQEVEEEIEKGRTTIKRREHITTKAEIKNMRVDVWTGMFYSNFVMLAIIATCAATLYAAGINNIGTAADAAAALKPLAGHFAYLLFTVGIIGIGLSSVPVLAGSAAYGIAESLRWNEGLSRRWNQAKLFYGTIIISMLIGLAMNFINLDPIKALIYAAVLNGIVAPFMIVYIVRIGASEKIMGHWKNGKFTNGAGWITAVAMFIVGAAAVYALFV